MRDFTVIGFSIGFWIIAENKLCDKQKVYDSDFEHYDNLH